ncbi:putative uncharacterized protein [Eggerthella sp. CAG:1427]|nr:putative uncharacterized protein [Eggerthella sp. CAG:1427]
MALKREYGGIQPCIRLGIFRIRIPFIHFNISGPEVITGLMNACTSYGALAVLISTLGLDPNTAYALVIFETACYTLSWFLGEPAVCGWITAAMAVIVLYLETLPEGVIRFQALTVIQLELGILFIVLGATGLSKKLNMILPPALKGGIVLGAGINSVVARMSEGGALDTATIACLGGLVVVCLFMFSQRIREKMSEHKILALLGNYSFLWGVLFLFIVGGISGDFQYEFSGQFIVMPDFGALFAAVSPFFIGFCTDPTIWISGIPYALTAWIIAYGDFITVQQLCINSARDDEYIEFNVNRTNIVCGIRNVVLSLFAPYPALAGPFSPPYAIATFARYKESGREGMNSIYDGTGTNLIFTVVGLFFYPLYEVSLAASGALLVVIMVVQGFVCAQIAINLLRDDMDRGIAGMSAGFIVARGASIGLPASIILYLLLCNNRKIRIDYATSKEELRLEEEETAKQLKALEERMAKAKAEHEESK